ncbi:MAG: thioredoxin family protein [Candidatus Gastranaerophilaceae bacterium]
MIKELNKESFDENTKSGLILVEFYAPWCGYCKKQSEILNELSNITIFKVNCDENPELAAEFGITGYPSFAVFKNGRAVHTFSGLHSKSDLMNILMHFFMN